MRCSCRVCGASPTSNDFQAEKSFHIDEGLFAEYLTRVTHRGEDNAAWRLRYRFAVEVSPRCVRRVRVSQVADRPVERGQESEVSEPESDNTKDLLHTPYILRRSESGITLTESWALESCG